MPADQALSIVLAQGWRTQCEELQKYLLEQSDVAQVEWRQNGLDAVRYVQESHPDVVVLDLLLAQLDGFGVLEAIATIDPEIRPTVLVVSALNRMEIVERALSMGADYYMIRPVSCQTLMERIRDVMAFRGLRPSNSLPQQPRAPISIDEKLTSLFLTLGIPAHIKGYVYLREGVKLAMNEPEIISAITKRLYPSIAKKCDSTPSKVERAIRHAIEVAWSRGNIDSVNEEMGHKILSPNIKPTNGEFIALIADRMRLLSSA